MSRWHKAHVLPPLGWRPTKQAAPKPTRVVVVHKNDLFALAHRMDPNVFFWAVGNIDRYTTIPEYITDIWISPRIDDAAIRLNLVSQAIRRDLIIWKNPAGELFNKLLPIWGFPGNLQPLESTGHDADPEEIRFMDLSFLESEEGDHTGVVKQLTAITPEVGPLREVGFLESEEEDDDPKTKTAVWKGRLARGLRKHFLKLAAARYQKRKLLTFKAPRALKASKRSLDSLPELDRKLYEAYQHDGLNGVSLAKVADSYGIPQANVPRILKRIENRLAT